MDVEEKIRVEKIEDPMLLKFGEQIQNGTTNYLCMIHPYQQIYRKNYMDFHQNIQNFEVYEDDTWICTHIKSGTRWMQELVSCLKYGLDGEIMKTVQVDKRVPYFDFDIVSPSDEPENSIKSSALLERPRTIKTHLSYDMLPKQVKVKKPKIICVIRNPRDVCVSMLNHIRLIDNYTGDMATLVDIFTRDVGFLSGPFFVNVFSYWKRRHELPNLLIVSYEEMQSDLSKVVRKVAEFLEVPLKEEHLPNICNHLSFDAMKRNPMTNFSAELDLLKKNQGNKNEGTFINKGKTGNWKEHLNEDMIKKFEVWEEKWLKGTDLSFAYEL